MSGWLRTAFQKQREQQNANRAYHLATQRNDHEFPARDSQGRLIPTYFLGPPGAQPSTDYRFWTSDRLSGSWPEPMFGEVCGEFRSQDGVLGNECEGCPGVRGLFGPARAHGLHNVPAT